MLLTIYDYDKVNIPKIIIFIGKFWHNEGEQPIYKLRLHNAMSVTKLINKQTKNKAELLY